MLGVTGSIAAYKAAELTSQLTRQGCEVHVVLTAEALRFITAVTFKVLSRHPVVTDLYDDDGGWQPAHIKLAETGSVMDVAHEISKSYGDCEVKSLEISNTVKITIHRKQSR